MDVVERGHGLVKNRLFTQNQLLLWEIAYLYISPNDTPTSLS
jgi:hypothetical protein